MDTPFVDTPFGPAPEMPTPIRGFSNVPWRKRAFGPCTKYVFLEVFLGIPGHFICSSARCAPWVVPSTFRLQYF